MAATGGRGVGVERFPLLWGWGSYQLWDGRTHCVGQGCHLGLLLSWVDCFLF